MSTKQAYLHKFQQLLYELFQFDKAELDFGIYRIMGYKRDQIRQFIKEDLAQEIDKEIKREQARRQKENQKDIEEIKKEIEEKLDPDAFEKRRGRQHLKHQYHNTNIGKEWLELQKATEGIKKADDLVRDAYIHLYNFFSRYYEEGDFISKRRSSSIHNYVIPYGGEEVLLHWANKDQYYIKSVEHFANYEFRVGNRINVRFELISPEISQDNKQGGDNRYFVPEPAENRREKNTLILPIYFRSLTADEESQYASSGSAAKKNGKKTQSNILRWKYLEAQQTLKGADVTKLFEAQEEETQPLLEKHLERYVRRNISDYFIHKNLKGFLLQELDSYLKNEYLNAEALAEHGVRLAPQIFVLFGVIRRMASFIIDFLAQIEEFQKMLWEKRKFILETHYCVAMHKVTCKDLISQIACTDSQWREWKGLGMLEEAKELANKQTDQQERIAYLKQHGSLMLDTRHFDEVFYNNLLAQIEDIDANCGGILIHGENFQGLNILAEKYRGKVKCVHIDPPYNPEVSRFIYKNNYRHSSWLSMMENRIVAVLPYLTQQGSFICHIDENEYERLRLLLDNFPMTNAGTLVWDKRHPLNRKSGLTLQHEYVLWRTKGDSLLSIRKANAERILKKSQEIIKKYGGVNEEARSTFKNWVKKQKNQKGLSEEELESCEIDAGEIEFSGDELGYCEIDKDGRVYGSVHMGASQGEHIENNRRRDPKFYKPLIHPITGKPCPVPQNGWNNTPEFMKSLEEEGKIIFGVDETTQPRRKQFLNDHLDRKMTSVYSSGKKGRQDLRGLGLMFPYCHPVDFYQTILEAVSLNENEIVVDYFAGSGTTAHALINLNRADKGNRKFILMEVNDYFDTVLLPRIKKIVYSPDWRNGRAKNPTNPEQMQGVPSLIKYHRLESYEDSLDNISFKEDDAQLKYDDYVPKYILKWESRHCETLLATTQLNKPFDYKLRLSRADPARPRSVRVDLAETFNYLIGLYVRTRRIYFDGKRRYLVYRGQVDNQDTMVIWRDTENWKDKDWSHDREFITKAILKGGEAGQVLSLFVNSDSLVEGARSLDPLFKKRMFVNHFSN